MLTLLIGFFCLCGCAGRMNTDLLQARIREQATQLSDSQREVAKTRSELKQSRLEAEKLKSELAQTNSSSDLKATSSVQIQKIRINPLACGGLNKDEIPGDDTVLVQFVPVDRENEPVKSPGEIEFTIVDPQLNEQERELGRWTFTTEQCRDHWTRGITSSGFQFSLPLEQPPRHTDLVVHLRYKTRDARQYDVNHIVKVATQNTKSNAQNARPRNQLVQVVDEWEEPLPPVGDEASNNTEEDLPDWARDEQVAKPLKPGHTVLHSANWTDATIPQLR